MTPARAHFDALDGLRGIAAVAVVLHHALSPFGLEKTWLPHAQLAVDFFFALSGFVIASAYERRLREGFGNAAFMRQRLLRLYPLMLAGLLLGLAVQMLRAPAEAAELAGALLFHLLWLPDLQAWWNGSGATWPLNVALWSLSTEMGLSLAFGLLLYRLGDRTLAWVLLPCGLAVIALAIALGAVQGGHNLATWWAGPVRGLYPFVAGVLLWRWHAAADQPRTVHAAWAPLLLLAIFLWPSSSAAAEAVAVLLAVPAIVALGARVQSTGRVASASRWLGRLSFPLYALHYPVVQLASGLARRLQWDAGWHLAVVVTIELAASITLALLAARYWDEPLRRALASLRSGRGAIRGHTLSA